MHGVLLNQADLRFRLTPRTPLLVKSGSEGAAGLDPTAVDMQFVRTRSRREAEGQVYLPGASLRGVLRSYAEKLLRSVDEDAACDPNRQECIRLAEKSSGKKSSDWDGPEAYRFACQACKVFGNTALASRLRISDLSLVEQPVLETRFGVAIDRVTGAVAHGPFELETVTGGAFEGQLQLRNFTLGHLSLISAALLDLADGVVAMGYGKSRGLGRVRLQFLSLEFRLSRNEPGKLLGVGALASEQRVRDYQLPAADQEKVDGPPGESSSLGLGTGRGLALLRCEPERIGEYLDGLTGHWVRQLSGGAAV